MISDLKVFLKRMLRIWNFDSTAMIAKNVDIKNSKLGRYTNLAHDASIVNSSIGSRTSVGRYTFVRYAEVGKFCAISWRCTIGADGHPIDRISGSGAFYRPTFGIVPGYISKGEVATTHIGNDVWIGCDVIIVSGVRVGDGAVIGAGSIVTKDVEPYGIYVGSPARKIGSRFDQDIIDRLEKLKWWDLPDKVLKENYKLFQQSMTDEILTKLENIR